jgi:microcin C transport system substrate-binding protein
MLIDRRFALKLLGALGISGGAKLVGVNTAFGQEHDWRHGLSLFGELKYPADFEHFDYVNPDAPKGGRAASMPSAPSTASIPIPSRASRPDSSD